MADNLIVPGPYEFLKRFYEERKISAEDSDENNLRKLRELSGLVQIPNWTAERKPYLIELEEQLMKDYHVL
jgi:hypothetical protein